MIVPRVRELLREEGMSDAAGSAGGIVPGSVAGGLKETGVARKGRRAALFDYASNSS